MTISQTQEILLKWIKSCSTRPHCDLMLEIIDQYIKVRYEGKVEERELIMVKQELMNSLIEQRMAIVWGKLQDTKIEAPTLAYYLNDNDPDDLKDWPYFDKN